MIFFHKSEKKHPLSNSSIPPDQVPIPSNIAASSTHPPSGAAGQSQTEDLAPLIQERDQIIENIKQFEPELAQFKARKNQQYLELLDSAHQKIILDILPLLDDLERSQQVSANAEALRQGLKLIANKFRAVLDKYGVEMIDHKVALPDPELHELVDRLELARPGYKINKRICCRAKVFIPKPMPHPAAEKNNQN